MHTGNMRYREVKFEPAQAKDDPPRHPGGQSLCLVSEIATPDAVEESATDLGVRGVFENVGVTGLALVSPPLGLIVADAVETRQFWPLAKPSSDKDVLEVVGVTRGKDLTVGAGVELVLHLAGARFNAVHGVAGELCVLCKGLEAQVLAPLGDDSHVAGT